MNGLIERMVELLESIAGSLELIAPGNGASEMLDSLESTPDSASETSDYQALVAAGDMTKLRALSRAKGLTYGPKSKAETLADNLRKYDAEHGGVAPAPAAAPAPAPAAAPVVPDPFAAVPAAPEVPQLTQKDIVTVLQKVATSVNLDAVYELLKIGGVNQVANLDPKFYPQVYAEAQKYVK